MPSLRHRSRRATQSKGPSTSHCEPTALRDPGIGSCEVGAQQIRSQLCSHDHRPLYQVCGCSTCQRPICKDHRSGPVEELHPPLWLSGPDPYGPRNSV
ncbi:hypothetical protein GDO81_001097 [Engystomops pustulosus]|uniref:Uncharacterized protein n=1 Tax=Engystomops pustulosus TaxID=76066 RepID=A0AAV7DAJ9_ENGPU|nr:hypothetical protein GDO81_001097 [Engystomops pustulosus]